MNLKIKPIDDADRSSYELFIASPANFDHATFYHTWEWGELMRGRALAFERLGIYQNEKLVATGQFAQQKLKTGTFWYCPRGLVLDYSNTDLITEAYRTIKAHFKNRKGAGFLRVDPDIIRGDAAESAIDILKPKQAYIFTQAERVWLVDLQKNEQELMEWMKNNGVRSNVPRYMRRATAAGITVRASDKPEDLETLITMLHAMSKRKGGVGMQNDNSYRTQFAAMAPAGYEKVFLAEKDGQVLAAAMIAIYGKEGSYLHGASSDVERNLSAPHKLHLEIMKYIQENHPEAIRYNFWGIVSDKNRNPKHPRHGYSEFKRSFGGYKVQYIRSRDFVYKPSIWQASQLIDRYRTYRYKND